MNWRVEFRPEVETDVADAGQAVVGRRTLEARGRGWGGGRLGRDGKGEQRGDAEQEQGEKAGGFHRGEGG